MKKLRCTYWFFILLLYLGKEELTNGKKYEGEFKANKYHGFCNVMQEIPIHSSFFIQENFNIQMAQCMKVCFLKMRDIDKVCEYIILLILINYFLEK